MGILEDKSPIRSGLKDVSIVIIHYVMLFHSQYVDSKASDKVSSLLSSTQLINDVTRLSPTYQTSSLEAYHSVIIHFAPKYAALSYQGMHCRYYSICVHFYIPLFSSCM